MQGFLLVFLGAGVGGALRHAVYVWGARLIGTPTFPVATLAINISGSFFLGLVAGWLALRGGLANNSLRLLLATGISGGYTTFSAFSLEMVVLLERQKYLLAGLYAGSSVAASVIGLAIGLWIMRTTLA